jgi:Uma2 family endonuclease
MKVMKTISSENELLENVMKTKEKISYEDFLALCDEDTLAEWVDGEIIMTSPASERHQDIARFLMILMSDYVEYKNLGKVIMPPFQIKLGKNLPGREPDLLYISNARVDHIKNTYMDGPADMVIEIISEESESRDRDKKFFEYEAAGIPEYWLIDPIRQQAEFYRIATDNHYHFVPLDANGIYRSEAVEGFWFKVSWLWQKPMLPVREIRRELGIP